MVKSFGTMSPSPERTTTAMDEFEWWGNEKHRISRGQGDCRYLQGRKVYVGKGPTSSASEQAS